jgi:hypothetical protein
MKRFRSRVDPWIPILLIVAVAGMISALIAVLLGDAGRLEKWIVATVTVLGVTLIASTLLRTHYTVSCGNLRVVSGPFAWNIAIAEITDISETRSPLSSPALSLNRLKIRYGRNRCIMVSPEDKKGFLEAIEKNSA